MNARCEAGKQFLRFCRDCRGEALGPCEGLAGAPPRLPALAPYGSPQGQGVSTKAVLAHLSRNTKVGDNPVTCHLTISGEKGCLAFERMDKLYLEQREEAFCQEADIEITIF